MGARSKYITDNISFICRKQTVEIAIFIYVDAYKTVLPNLSLDEVALSFLKHHKISEDELPIETLKKSYQRTRDAINQEEKIREGKNIFGL